MSAAVKAMCDQLVDERLRELASEDHAAAFAAHLATLERTHAGDDAMAAYVERSRGFLRGGA